MEVVIPYSPRDWQRAVHEDLHRFGVLVVHRRAGKTVLAINELIRRLATKPGQLGAYIAPQYRQAKRIAWPYLREYAGVIPGVQFNSSELMMVLPNGSKAYLLGAENPDPIRGLGLDYFVFDEVAQCPERAWREVVRPACADRRGGGLFIGTPMGMGNLFYRLYRDAEHTDGWTRTLLTVDETDALDASEVAALKAEMSEEEFAQEFMCDWSAAVKGAYYGRIMAQAEREGRIGEVPYEPELPVITAWDLGVADYTVIVFLQQPKGGQIRVIDCHVFQNEGLPQIKKQLDSLPYVYSAHYAPHDIKVREWGAGGKSRLEMAASLGIRFTVAPNRPVRDGIEATRALLARCVFDRKKCFDLVEALKTYRSSYDEVRQVFSTAPLHSWESHYADAMRMFAVSHAEHRTDRIDYSRFEETLI